MRTAVSNCRSGSPGEPYDVVRLPDIIGAVRNKLITNTTYATSLVCYLLTRAKRMAESDIELVNKAIDINSRVDIHI